MAYIDLYQVNFNFNFFLDIIFNGRQLMFIKDGLSILIFSNFFLLFLLLNLLFWIKSYPSSLCFFTD